MHTHQAEYDVIVIGAGAAGLMCALTAGARQRSVLVLDHASKAGSKIIISGGGRCNFTNLYAGADHFLSANPHFCKAALARFPAQAFIDMVERHGIDWHERDHGQLFCNDSARDILDMLLKECATHDVRVQTGTEIRQVEPLQKQPQHFRLATNRGDFSCTSLVIATGGLSIPKIGASNFGLKIAEQFGLSVRPPRPGLVPFTFTGPEKESLQQLAGISLPVQASCNGRSFREAMLFTHRGLSGPAMLQISSYWQPGDTLHIDLLPDVDIGTFLRQQQKLHPHAMLSTTLAHRLPKRLAQLLTSGLPLQEHRLQQLHERALAAIDHALHDWQLKPNGTEGYRTAEVTVGGVDTDELSSKTMQSRKIPGLYFIGEVVDVTGHLGGFNFQWAWASGHAAGLDA